MAVLPQNIIFLIALLIIMVAMVVFTFVFTALVDRSLRKDGESKRDSSNGEEGA